MDLPRPRAPQRQAYRLVELTRWREHLGVPLIIQPKHFPVNANPAACLICAAPEDKRMALAGEFLAALWKDDRNLADADVLKEIGVKQGVSAGDEGKYKAYTDEIFWRQDRLEFLDRAFAK